MHGSGMYRVPYLLPGKKYFMSSFFNPLFPFRGLFAFNARDHMYFDGCVEQTGDMLLLSSIPVLRLGICIPTQMLLLLCKLNGRDTVFRKARRFVKIRVAALQQGPVSAT